MTEKPAQTGETASAENETKKELSTEELLNFCKTAIDEKQDKQLVLKELRSCSAETISHLFDVLSILDHEIGKAKEGSSTNTGYKDFLKLVQDEFIPSEALTLEIADLIEPSDAQSLIRTRTRLYYKQLKFNLLREESEGYSKLLTELIDNEADLSSGELAQRILCLIGQFNLDPNRVCDVILEAFEASTDQPALFLELLTELRVSREYLTTILGFKLSSCQGSTNGTPYDLYLITAHLIENKFVRLEDICGYLSPTQEEIKGIRKRQLENITKRAKAAEIIHTSNITVEMKAQPQVENTNGSGISFATVLAQQELEDAKLGAEFDEERLLATNQKLGLTCALCEIGSWTLAKFLLECMPEGFALTAVPKISCTIAKMVDRSLDEFYQAKCSPHFVRRQRASSEKPKSLILQEVSNVKEFFALSEIVSILGPRLALRPKAYIKFLRVLKVLRGEMVKSKEDRSEELSRIRALLEEVILPGMTLLDQNCGVAEEVWELLQNLPYQERFQLYGRWRGLYTKKYPEITLQKGKILGRTKYLLKRLSKETARQMGRSLSKLCYVYPFAVFDYLLSQVQTFDNFIEPVVESIRFFSSLSFDVLIYCIISQLAASDKQQLKASDGSLSAWLQSLATLTGSVFRRYNTDIVPMLHYIVNQLKREKGFDLLILREIVHMMGGVEAYNGLTDEHLEALAGDKTLRQEGASFTVTRDKKACGRLRDAILQDDLAAGLYILMGQQHQCLAYKHSTHFPLKLTGELIDQCRDTMLQFAEFFVTNVEIKIYCQLVPTIGHLLGKFHLQMDQAMALYRPVFMREVNLKHKEAVDQLRNRVKKITAEEANGQMEVDAEPGEVNDAKANALDAALEQSCFKGTLEKELDKVAAEISDHMPGYAKKLPARTYALFWLLTRYDLEVPNAAYERALDATKKKIKEQSNSSEPGRIRRKEEERLRKIESKLVEEWARQKEHVQRVHAALSAMKDDLIHPKNIEQIGSLLQICFLARASISEDDALYSALFFKKLHAIHTTNFNTIMTIDKLFSDIVPLVLGLTECEAASVGRFLQAMMEAALHWRSDAAVWQKECHGRPGFQTRANPEAQLVSMEYVKYQRLCFKYQYLMGKSFAFILGQANEDYNIIRNTMLFLQKLMSVFPVVKFVADDMSKLAEQVRDREKGKRDDLCLKAASYMSHLKLRKTKIYETTEFSTTQGSTVTTIFDKPEPKRELKTNGIDGPAAKKRKVESGAAKEVKENGSAESKENVKSKEPAKPEKEKLAKENESPKGKIKPESPRMKSSERDIRRKDDDKGRRSDREKEKDRAREREKEKEKEREREKGSSSTRTATRIKDERKVVKSRLFEQAISKDRPAPKDRRRTSTEDTKLAGK
ncbi:unnamed protein product, partial [Mesorhabditis spiculigera]